MATTERMQEFCAMVDRINRAARSGASWEEVMNLIRDEYAASEVVIPEMEHISAPFKEYCEAALLVLEKKSMEYQRLMGMVSPRSVELFILAVEYLELGTRVLCYQEAQAIMERVIKDTGIELSWAICGWPMEDYRSMLDAAKLKVKGLKK